ncbi:hypothetical protein CFOL_v3_23815, partial [Cephalotus follicularis]
ISLTLYFSTFPFLLSLLPHTFLTSNNIEFHQFLTIFHGTTQISPNKYQFNGHNIKHLLPRQFLMATTHFHRPKIKKKKKNHGFKQRLFLQSSTSGKLTRIASLHTMPRRQIRQPKTATLLHFTPSSS